MSFSLSFNPTMKKGKNMYLAYYDQFMSKNPMYSVEVCTLPAVYIPQAAVLLSGAFLIGIWRYLVGEFAQFEPSSAVGVLFHVWSIILAAVAAIAVGTFVRKFLWARRVPTHLYNGTDSLLHDSQLKELQSTREAALHRPKHNAVDSWDGPMPHPEALPGGHHQVPPEDGLLLPSQGKQQQQQAGQQWQQQWHEEQDAQQEEKHEARQQHHQQLLQPAHRQQDDDLGGEIQPIEDESMGAGAAGPEEGAAAPKVTAEAAQAMIAAVDALQQAGSDAERAAQLYAIAERLLSNDAELLVLLQHGGLGVVTAAMADLTGRLEEGGLGVDLSAGSLQASWVLLLTANGPPEAKATLVNSGTVRRSVPFMAAITSSPHLPPEAKSTILRNLCWALFTLCDAPNAPSLFLHHHLLQEFSQQAAHELLDSGALPLLAAQIALSFGIEAASFAAPLLALLVQMPTDPPTLSLSALATLFQPECLHGLCYLLHSRTANERCRVILTSLVHFLISCRVQPFIHALTTEHLLGSFVRVMPSDLARLFICSLLSSSGQATLLEIEDEFALDVPLALAQVIPSDAHLILPGAETPDGDLSAPTCTCALTCRLLLLRERLPELLTAFFDELQVDHERADGGDREGAAGDAEGDAGGAGEGEAQGQGQQGEGEGPYCDGPSEVVTCVCELVQFLMREDIELQKYRLQRGEAIDCSSSSADSSAGAADDCAAASAADYDEAAAAARSFEDDEGACPARAAPPPSRHAFVDFDVGGETIRVDGATYEQLKQASKFVKSVLIRSDKREAIVVMRVPRFTDEENALVFRHLVAWARERRLDGLDFRGAQCLWQAAEFFQVDDLHVVCEDAMAAELATPEHLQAAFVLGATCLAGDRLLHMCTTHILRQLGALVGSPTLQQLQQGYRTQLERRLYAELRDRLSTVCALNGGVGLELPNVLTFA